MSRQHSCTYCAMILLFCSCELFAQDEPQDMDREAIRVVVKSYMEAIQQGSHANVVALSYFRDNEERQAFQESLKKRGAVRKWDLEKELHLVRFRRKDHDIQAMFLLPTKQGFLPESVSIREVSGQLRIVHEKEKKTSRENFTAVEAAIADLQETLESWKTARDATLSERCLVVKERLKEEIDALEYAKTKELQIVPGYGDLTRRLKRYEDVRDLSDEKLQAKMIQEIQDTLERLSR